jgi:hypothetical protein
MEKHRRVPAAALAVGLIALAALLGCGREENVASKSAAAFEEARKRGETFGGDGHAHGHGATSSDGEHEMPGIAQESGGAAGMAMEGMDHSGMAMGKEHSGKAMQGMDHSGMAMGKEHSGKAMEGMDHSEMAMGKDQSGKAMEGMDHSGMAMGGAKPSTEPVAVATGQPAITLRPDALDSPAPTSVQDAQRSAEMAEGMGGMEGMAEMAGHGGHGEGTYRHVDAGRGHEEHSQHEPPAGGTEEATIYACPMHPEVTSKTPGTCPKCGMTLVKRRRKG